MYLCNTCIWKMLNYYCIIQAVLFQITSMPHKLTLLVQDYFDDCKQLRLWFEHFLAHFNICYKRNVKLICRQIPYRYNVFSRSKKKASQYLSTRTSQYYFNCDPSIRHQRILKSLICFFANLSPFCQ